MTMLPPSKRGLACIEPDLMIDLSRRLARDSYDPSQNPNGIIDLGSAINTLMQKDLGSFTQRHLTDLDPVETLQYNDTQGSTDLLDAAASFMNARFHCHTPLKPEHILAANGVTTLLNTLAFSIAEDGDVILAPTPTYGMFSHDISTRNNLRLVSVPCDDLSNQRFKMCTGSLISTPIIGRNWRSALVQRVQQSLDDQSASGSRVAAVLLANPENPLGGCYSRYVLLELLQLCERNSLHLIVDEIYASTGFSNHQSALSLDIESNKGNLHVLWGMSKDFGCGGLRIGFLATYNNKLHAVMRAQSMFGWVSAWSAAAATAILSDKRYLDKTYFPALEKRLTSRRNKVLKRLVQLEIPFFKPEAGFFIFINLSRWLNKATMNSRRDPSEAEIELLEFMMSHRVFLEPGKAFFTTTPGWFRLNFGGTDDAFELGMQRLAKCLHLITSQDKTDEETELDEKLVNSGIWHGTPHRGKSSKRWRWWLCLGM